MVASPTMAAAGTRKSGAAGTRHEMRGVVLVTVDLLAGHRRLCGGRGRGLSCADRAGDPGQPVLPPGRTGRHAPQRRRLHDVAPVFVHVAGVTPAWRADDR